MQSRYHFESKNEELLATLESSPDAFHLVRRDAARDTAARHFAVDLQNS